MIFYRGGSEDSGKWFVRFYTHQNNHGDESNYVFKDLGYSKICCKISIRFVSMAFDFWLQSDSYYQVARPLCHAHEQLVNQEEMNPQETGQTEEKKRVKEVGTWVTYFHCFFVSSSY